MKVNVNCGTIESPVVIATLTHPESYMGQYDVIAYGSEKFLEVQYRGTYSCVCFEITDDLGEIKERALDAMETNKDWVRDAYVIKAV